MSAAFKCPACDEAPELILEPSRSHPHGLGLIPAQYSCTSCGFKLAAGSQTVARLAVEVLGEHLFHAIVSHYEAKESTQNAPSTD
jgi:predicted RNA-binding Zn-ribbon protein involved in translation (DUF1610 family)